MAVDNETKSLKYMHVTCRKMKQTPVGKYVTSSSDVAVTSSVSFQQRLQHPVAVDINSENNVHRIMAGISDSGKNVDGSTCLFKVI